LIERGEGPKNSNGNDKSPTRARTLPTIILHRERPSVTFGGGKNRNEKRGVLGALRPRDIGGTFWKGGEEAYALERTLPPPAPVPEAGFVEGLLHEVADAGQADLVLIKIPSKVLLLRGFFPGSIRCGGHLIRLR
jgi:hypothetical protein